MRDITDYLVTVYFAKGIWLVYLLLRYDKQISVSRGRVEVGEGGGFGWVG